MKRGIVTLFFLLFFSTIAYSQKGSWQIQLEKKLQTAQSQEDRLVLQCAIGQEMKEYSLPKAWNLANEVLGKAKQLTLPKAQAEAYSLIAEILRLRSRPYEAIAYHQKAYVIFEKEKQATALQRTKRDMAFATSNFSKFDSAQVILQEVVYWFEQHEPNTREHALSLYVLGINSIRLGKLQESLNYTRRAKKIFETLQDTYNQARSENNIGLIYKNMGYYKKGLEHYNKALQILEATSENQRATTTVLINMGNVYLSLNDSLYREPIFKYFERSHKISQHIQDTLQIIASIEALAKAEAFRKDFDKASGYYKEGLKSIQRTQNDLEEGYFSLRLSEIYTSWRLRRILIFAKTIKKWEKYVVYRVIVRLYWLVWLTSK
jgi:tetratricopeptide (TPR) repeat protein